MIRSDLVLCASPSWGERLFRSAALLRAAGDRVGHILAALAGHVADSAPRPACRPVVPAAGRRRVGLQAPDWHPGRMQWHWGNIGSALAGVSTAISAAIVAVVTLIRGPAALRDSGYTK